MLKRLSIYTLACMCIFFAQNLSFIQTFERDFMALTESTFHVIVGFEGKRNKAYKDTRGLWTIGVGHLIKPDEQHLINAVLTDAQVEELFKSDAQWCDEAIRTSVKVPITQNQYDALASLCYNIGANGFKTSRLVKALNTGNYKLAGEYFMDWVHPSVLVNRRKQEKTLFLQDI